MELKNCPVCGAGNSELAKFCYACGADLRTEQTSPELEKERDNQSQSVYEQPVAEYQYQYTNAENQRQSTAPFSGQAQENPCGQPNGGYQAPPQQGAPYHQAGGYQIPPYGQPTNGYQVPPQANPYQQPYYGYQMPPQGMPYPLMPPVVPYGYRQKSKIAAGILGILLGVFGVHNFYLGYNGKAVAQLLLSIVLGVFTCGISTAAVSIWGLVEGIMILCGSINLDGRNVPLSD